MIDQRPSRTAFRVALRRAAHQLLDQPLVFVDPIALRIIGSQQADAIRADPAKYNRHRGARSLRALLAVRSRVAEDALAGAVANGVRQYVVLGAGLDTFAYRNSHEALGLHVFEVDHPATQAWKRGALEKFAIDIPDSVTFVPVDFERQTAAAELMRSGWNPAEPTFFSWLGVTMYLTEETVLATLAWVAEVGGTGGGVVFDYALSSSELGLLHRLLYHLVARRVRRAGEPWISRYVPTELVAKLRRLGFREVEDLSDDVLNATYFSDRQDDLRIRGLAHIMRAMT